jgi:hypothetical protein
MDRRRRLMANNVRSALDTLLTSGLTFSAPLTDTVVLGQGTGSATFTRATVATVTDHEDVLRDCLSGEVRFQGARRVYNLCPTPSTTIAIAGNKTITVGVGTFVFSMGAEATGTSLITFTGTATGSTGTLTANASSRTSKTLTITVGGTIIATCTVAAANNIQFEDVTGQSIQTPGEYVSVGVLSSPFHGAMVDGVKYFATTNGNTVASNVVTEATGSPISSATLKGYLAEGARTNLCLQSNAFTTTWTNSGGLAATQNQTGPDGATSAWTMTGTGAQTNQQAITLTAATYTESIYVKKTTGATGFPILRASVSPLTALCTIDTNNGIATIWTALDGGWTIVTSSATCVDAGNFWRVSLTFLATAASWTLIWHPLATTNATQSSGSLLGATGTSVCYGAQLEAGSFASTYIPTTTVAVPRNADVLTYPFAGNASDTVGSAYAEVSSVQTTGIFGNTCIIGFAVGVAGPLVQLSGNALTAITIRDGTNAATKTGITSLATGPQKLSASWGTGIYVTGSGLAPATNATFGGTFGATAIGIGCATGGTLHPFVTIRNVRIYSTQLSASQLQAVTA